MTQQTIDIRLAMQPVVGQGYRLWAIWGYLIYHAAHSAAVVALEGTSSKISISAGQLVTSVRRIADDIGLTPKRVRHSLDFFIAQGNAKIKRAKWICIITIVNWDTYLVFQNEIGQNKNDFCNCRAKLISPKSAEISDTYPDRKAAKGQNKNYYETKKGKIEWQKRAKLICEESAEILDGYHAFQNEIWQNRMAKKGKIKSDEKSTPILSLPSTRYQNNTRLLTSANNIYSAFSENSSQDTIITRKKRKLRGEKLAAFKKFWNEFNYKRGRAEAADAWLDIPDISAALVAQIIAAAAVAAKERPAIIAAGQTPKMAQGWLTGRRWEDYDQTDIAQQQARVAEQQRAIDRRRIIDDVLAQRMVDLDRILAAASPEDHDAYQRDYAAYVGTAGNTSAAYQQAYARQGHQARGTKIYYRLYLAERLLPPEVDQIRDALVAAGYDDDAQDALEAPKSDDRDGTGTDVPA